MSSSLLGLVALGQQLDEAVEQVAGAEPLRGGDGHRLAQPEAVEVVDEREVARRCRSCWRPARPAGRRGAACRPPPRRRRACPALRVDHEQRDVGVGQRLAHLVPDRDGERVGVLEVDAAGVDQRERPAVPVGRELLAVARDPRTLVHDRLARLREAVDERGLADVRIADDGDLPHVAISFASTASVTIWSTTSSSVSPVVSTGTASGAARAASARGCGRARRASPARASTTSASAAELGGAAARALLRDGGEEDLDLGVGRDDRADVAPLGDPVALGEDAPLLRDERLAHGRVGGDARGGLGHPRLADALGDVLAVEQDALAELEPRARARPRPGRGARAREADRAVHRPRVEVREAEPLRGGAGDRGLAGPGGTVDGDDHGAERLGRLSRAGARGRP